MNTSTSFNAAKEHQEVHLMKKQLKKFKAMLDDQEYQMINSKLKKHSQGDYLQFEDPMRNLDYLMNKAVGQKMPELSKILQILHARF